MSWRYDRLWQVLKDRGIRRSDLAGLIGSGSSTITRMGKGEPVSLDVIDRICQYLGCMPDDILEYVPSEKGGESE